MTEPLRLSGAPGSPCTRKMVALLREAGRLYVPLLLASAQARQAGQAALQAAIDGQPWVQQALPGQCRCLAWLRRDHAALPPAHGARAETVLAGSDCEALFSP